MGHIASTMTASTQRSSRAGALLGTRYVPYLAPLLALGLAAILLELFADSSTLSDGVKLASGALLLGAIGAAVVLALPVDLTPSALAGLALAVGLVVVTAAAAWASWWIQPARSAFLGLAASTIAVAALAGRGEVRLRVRREPWLNSAALLLPAGVALAHLPAILVHDYYLGYDGYSTAVFGRALLEGPVPITSFSELPANFAGAYAAGAFYDTAWLSAALGISVEGVTRFGGLAVFALVAYLVGVVADRLFDTPAAGPIAGLAFAASPFIEDRFVLLIRENVGWIVWLATLVVLVSLKVVPNQSVVFMTALISGVAIQIHALAGGMAVASILVFWAAGRLGERRRSLLPGAAGLLFGILPSGFGVIAAWSRTFLPAQVQAVQGTLGADASAAFVWEKAFEISDLYTGALVVVPLGLLVCLVWWRDSPLWLVMVPPALFVTAATAAQAVGASVPLVRTIIYIGFLASLLAGSLAALAWRLVGASSGRHSHPSRRSLRVGWRTAVAVAVVGLMAMGVGRAWTFRKWSPFSEAQVEAASMLDSFGLEDSVVLAPFSEVILLWFAGIEQVETDRVTVNSILTADDPAALVEMLESEAGPNGRVLVYASRRFVADGVDVYPDYLSGWDRPFSFYSNLRAIDPPGLSLGVEPYYLAAEDLCVLQHDIMGIAYVHEVLLGVAPGSCR